MAMMAVMLPLAANAQTYNTRRCYSDGRCYTTTRVYKKPSFYQRHRDKINLGIGTAAGAILGGLIGGKRGAGIGALAGLGGGALYTYKIKPKNRAYYYQRRNYYNR